MSPTCKLKTFHEHEVLISYCIIRKTFRKFPMHYVNTTSDFWGNSPIEKRKNLVIESSNFCVE